MAAVTLVNVVKSFGKTNVIHGVDLEIEDGEFCVFVGPSGCGKSTLLRMISGLEKTTSGTISIGDRDVTNLDPSERQVAMVFQTYALYPHMTVEKNMGFGLKMAGVAQSEITDKVHKAADILRLGPYLKRVPKELSGGQRQRVAIGRAIVRGPQVFLFDEPLSNLDAELRVEMRVELAQLHQDFGTTMIYVTHDQTEAMTLAKKIVVLRGGNIEQIGPPMNLYQNPNNRFVAGFIGSPAMNFFSGRSEHNALTLPSMGGQKLNTNAQIPNNTELLVGVRPQHIKIISGNTHKVELIEHLGDVHYIYLKSLSDESFVVETGEPITCRVGEQVSIDFPHANAYLFNPDNEKRLR